MGWLTDSLGTLLAVLSLACVLGLAVRTLLRDKKKGRSSCGGCCGSCPMGGTCRRDRS